MEHPYFGWNIIIRIWAAGGCVLTVMELLLASSLEEQQFLLEGIKEPPEVLALQHEGRSSAALLAAQIFTFLRVSFSWRSSWFFSPILCSSSS